MIRLTCDRRLGVKPDHIMLALLRPVSGSGSRLPGRYPEGAWPRYSDGKLASVIQGASDIIPVYPCRLLQLCNASSMRHSVVAAFMASMVARRCHPRLQNHLPVSRLTASAIISSECCRVMSSQVGPADDRGIHYPNPLCVPGFDPTKPAKNPLGTYQAPLLIWASCLR